MNSYLVTKKIKNVEYRFFSCGIPSDLKKQLNNSRRFYLSLNNLKDFDVRFLCKHLNGIAKNLFQEIRIGMRELNLDDIKNLMQIKDLWGAITGKALYSGTLDLKEAIEVSRS